MKSEKTISKFFDAVLEGEIRNVKRILDDGNNINVADKYGCNALMIAATNGHDDIVALLLDRCADVNAQNGYGQSAFMHAVIDGTMVSVKLLLEHGADVNLQDSNGRSGLDYANVYRNRSAIDLIESYQTAKTEKEFLLSSVVFETNEFSTRFGF